MDASTIVRELGFNIISEDTRKIHIRRCPVCNDGSSHKPRGYFLLNDNRTNATYFCHNCEGDGLGGVGLYNMCIENNRPDLAISLLKDNIGNHYNSIKEDTSLLIDDTTVNYLSASDLTIGKLRTGEPRVVKIYKIDEKIARYLLIERKIPKNKINNFVKTDRGFGILYTNGLNVYNMQERNDGGYFFIDQDKSKSFKLSNVYNIFNINKSAPVIATEGVIDSLFINNSVSIGGASKWRSLLDMLIYLQVPSIYFLQDNDKAGKNTVMKVLSDCVYAFKWKQFLRDNNINDEIKDVNDLYIKGYAKGILTFSHLRKYFTNSQSELLLI